MGVCVCVCVCVCMSAGLCVCANGWMGWVGGWGTDAFISRSYASVNVCVNARAHYLYRISTPDMARNNPFIFIYLWWKRRPDVFLCLLSINALGRDVRFEATEFWLQRPSEGARIEARDLTWSISPFNRITSVFAFFRSRFASRGKDEKSSECKRKCMRFIKRRAKL